MLSRVILFSDHRRRAIALFCALSVALSTFPPNARKTSIPDRSSPCMGSDALVNRLIFFPIRSFGRSLSALELGSLSEPALAGIPGRHRLPSVTPQALQMQSLNGGGSSPPRLNIDIFVTQEFLNALEKFDAAHAATIRSNLYDYLSSLQHYKGNLFSVGKAQKHVGGLSELRRYRSTRIYFKIMRDHGKLQICFLAVELKKSLENLTADELTRTTLDRKILNPTTPAAQQFVLDLYRDGSDATARSEEVSEDDPIALNSLRELAQRYETKLGSPPPTGEDFERELALLQPDFGAIGLWLRLLRGNPDLRNDLITRVLRRFEAYPETIESINRIEADYFDLQVGSISPKDDESAQSFESKTVTDEMSRRQQALEHIHQKREQDQLERLRAAIIERANAIEQPSLAEDARKAKTPEELEPIQIELERLEVQHRHRLEEDHRLLTVAVRNRSEAPVTAPQRWKQAVRQAADLLRREPEFTSTDWPEIDRAFDYARAGRPVLLWGSFGNQHLRAMAHAGGREYRQIGPLASDMDDHYEQADTTGVSLEFIKRIHVAIRNVVEAHPNEKIPSAAIVDKIALEIAGVITALNSRAIDLRAPDLSRGGLLVVSESDMAHSRRLLEKSLDCFIALELKTDAVNLSESLNADHHKVYEDAVTKLYENVRGQKRTIIGQVGRQDVTLYWMRAPGLPFKKPLWRFASPTIRLSQDEQARLGLKRALFAERLRKGYRGQDVLIAASASAQAFLDGEKRKQSERREKVWRRYALPVLLTLTMGVPAVFGILFLYHRPPPAPTSNEPVVSTPINGDDMFIALSDRFFGYKNVVLERKTLETLPALAEQLDWAAHDLEQSDDPLVRSIPRERFTLIGPKGRLIVMESDIPTTAGGIYKPIQKSSRDISGISDSRLVINMRVVGSLAAEAHRLDMLLASGKNRKNHELRSRLDQVHRLFEGFLLSGLTEVNVVLSNPQHYVDLMNYSFQNLRSGTQALTTPLPNVKKYLFGYTAYLSPSLRAQWNFLQEGPHGITPKTIMDLNISPTLNRYAHLWNNFLHLDSDGRLNEKDLRIGAMEMTGGPLQADALGRISVPTDFTDVFILFYAEMLTLEISDKRGQVTSDGWGVPTESKSHDFFNFLVDPQYGNSFSGPSPHASRKAEDHLLRLAA